MNTMAHQCMTIGSHVVSCRCVPGKLAKVFFRRISCCRFCLPTAPQLLPLSHPPLPNESLVGAQTGDMCLSKTIRDVLKFNFLPLALSLSLSSCCSQTFILRVASAAPPPCESLISALTDDMCFTKMIRHAPDPHPPPPPHLTNSHPQLTHPQRSRAKASKCIAGGFPGSLAFPLRASNKSLTSLLWASPCARRRERAGAGGAVEGRSGGFTVRPQTEHARCPQQDVQSLRCEEWSSVCQVTANLTWYLRVRRPAH